MFQVKSVHTAEELIRSALLPDRARFQFLLDDMEGFYRKLFCTGLFKKVDLKTRFQFAPDRTKHTLSGEMPLEAINANEYFSLTSVLMNRGSLYYNLELVDNRRRSTHPLFQSLNTFPSIFGFLGTIDRKIGDSYQVQFPNPCELNSRIFSLNQKFPGLIGLRHLSIEDAETISPQLYLRSLAHGFLPRASQGYELVHDLSEHIHEQIITGGEISDLYIKFAQGLYTLWHYSQKEMSDQTKYLFSCAVKQFVYNFDNYSRGVTHALNTLKNDEYISNGARSIFQQLSVVKMEQSDSTISDASNNTLNMIFSGNDHGLYTIATSLGWSGGFSKKVKTMKDYLKSLVPSHKTGIEMVHRQYDRLSEVESILASSAGRSHV